MTEVYLDDLVAQFPTTMAEEAERRLNAPDTNVREKLIAYGARLVLQGGSTRETRTAQIALDIGSTESTIFRIYPGKLIESIEGDGGMSVKDSYVAPRHQALTEAAVRLAVDEDFDFNTAVSRWSRVYANIANPSGIFSLGYTLPRLGRELAAEHANIITRSVNLLGLRDNIRANETFGKLVMHSTAGVEMFDRSELGLATEGLIHAFLSSTHAIPEKAEPMKQVEDIGQLVERIRVAREESGLTQEQFGEIFGVSRYVIHRIEKGKYTGEQNIRKLAAQISDKEPSQA